MSRLSVRPLGALAAALVAVLIGGCAESASTLEDEVFAASATRLVPGRWNKRFGDASDQAATSVVRDSQNNVIFTGEMTGTVNFGGSNLTSLGQTDIFLVKLDAAGAHVWSKRYGATQADSGVAVAVDSLDNIYLAAKTKGTVTFGCNTHASVGDDDILIAKLNPNGLCAWSYVFGSAGPQTVTSIDVDASDAAIIAGHFTGTVKFGVGGRLTSAGGTDIFVAKFHANSVPMFARRFGDASDQVATSVHADAASNILVGGSFAGTLNIQGVAHVSSGGNDGFIAKFNSSVDHVVSKRFGGTADESVTAVRFDSQGNMLALGNASGALDVGCGPLAGGGGSDVLLAKFNSTTGCE